MYIHINTISLLTIPFKVRAFIKSTTESNSAYPNPFNLPSLSLTRRTEAVYGIWREGVRERGDEKVHVYKLHVHF